MGYITGIKIGLITYFGILFYSVSCNNLPASCEGQRLDNCFTAAYNEAGITRDIPHTANAYFVSNYGILQIADLISGPQDYKVFCDEIFPELKLDIFISCLREPLQTCSTDLVQQTAANVDKDSPDHEVAEAFLRMITDLLYWSNHFLSTYVKHMCDDGCEDLPTKNTNTNECFGSGQEIFTKLDTRKTNVDYKDYNGEYCQTSRTFTECIWSQVNGCFILTEAMLSLFYFLQHLEAYDNFENYWTTCQANSNLIPPILPGIDDCESNSYMRCIVTGLQAVGADLGYVNGTLDDAHLKRLEDLVNDHDETCRYVPHMNLKKLQHCVVDTGRGCITPLEQLYTYSELHRTFHWMCHPECDNLLDKKAQIDETCKHYELQSDIETIELELLVDNADIQEMCGALNNKLTCIHNKAGTCPLIWDTLATELSNVKSSHLLKVEEACQSDFSIYAEPCGKEDPELKRCLDDAIPHVLTVIGVDTTLQETLQVIASMSVRQDVFCDDFLPNINKESVNNCIGNFQSRCEGTYFSVWMDTTRPTLSDALNHMCSPACSNYNLKVRELGRCYLDSRQREVFTGILKEIKRQGSTEELCSQLLKIDDCALTHVNKCEPMETLYDDHIVMYERHLHSDGINVTSEIKKCRGTSNTASSLPTHLLILYILSTIFTRMLR